MYILWCTPSWINKVCVRYSKIYYFHSKIVQYAIIYFCRCQLCHFLLCRLDKWIVLCPIRKLVQLLLPLFASATFVDTLRIRLQYYIHYITFLYFLYILRSCSTLISTPLDFMHWQIQMLNVDGSEYTMLQCTFITFHFVLVLFFARNGTWTPKTENLLNFVSFFSASFRNFAAFSVFVMQIPEIAFRLGNKRTNNNRRKRRMNA